MVSFEERGFPVAVSDFKAPQEVFQILRGRYYYQYISLMLSGHIM
jgi:hypothetical protein